ncbi:MAG: DNA repair protein RecN [Gammaproteobacteria bacterium]|nr:DNA repair protein RecN [Gammaproteobacteria bacterium]
MLSHLTIRSLAVIDSLELDCAPGMTALTGETGAGKSIVVDALALLLGARASSDMIRAGAERAEVCGVFETASNESARTWLAHRDLEEGPGECIVRRVVGPGSRSRAYVNQRPVPLQLLRELGEHLVDIHGQHVHHLLLDRDRQRIIVDDFGGHHALLRQVAETATQWHDLRREIAEIAEQGEERTSRLDFLQFQLDELEGLRLGADEPERLAGEQRRLANAESILDDCHRALDRLEGDHERSAATACAGARRDLELAARHDSRAQEVLDLVDAAVINVTEASTALRAMAETLDLDPERLAEVERRLGLIHELARKHRVSPRELPARTERLRERVSLLESGEQRAAELERKAANAEAEHRRLCARLTDLRRESADRLAQGVTQNMAELGMPGGGFAVDIRTLDTPLVSRNGADRVEFIVSAGPGQHPRPLSKVASGGELSRISLAIRVSSVRGSAVPTLVFDEADVGIGGRVAEIVGRRLRALGESHQILCVTHLAQVASRAHHQAVVRKSLGCDGTPGIDMTTVHGRDRIEEIARMLGGERITSKTVAHAREMLDGP